MRRERKRWSGRKRKEETGSGEERGSDRIGRERKRQSRTKRKGEPEWKGKKGRDREAGRKKGKRGAGRTHSPWRREGEIGEARNALAWWGKLRVDMFADKTGGELYDERASGRGERACHGEESVRKTALTEERTRRQCVIIGEKEGLDAITLGETVEV